ncbi:calcium-binding protein [Solirubrobacter soli]|uniref:calcium-binding protein n=1 Tax=Solirubrobacter soli TaxID=363832 RepID=UPI000415A56D|nr:calcium-binding protein [Solirubrobacter soli]
MKRPLLLAAFATALFAVPASAQAAVVGDEDGATVFRAGAGESNAVYSAGGFPTAFRDLGAPVHVNAPCTDDGATFSCPTAPVFYLNDRADIGWIITNFGPGEVHGGGGADDLFVSASQDARAEGDSGDDIVDVSASLTGYGLGGSGDDRIAGGGPTDGASVLDGGGDDDLVAHAGSQFATLGGGSGDDRVVGGNALSGTLTGGGGNDVLTFANGAAAQGVWTIDGGSGNDTITGHPAHDVVHGGSGNDRIDVADGNADDVDCDGGLDIVYADVIDTVASDCELRLNFRGPRNSAVESARSAAAALIARPHPFP